MKRVYVAHPFSGNEEENRIKAREQASDLYKLGYAVLNPCDCIRYMEDKSYAEALDVCLVLLSGCEELLLSKGWEESRGCVIETAYALKHNIPIRLLPDFSTPGYGFREKVDVLVRYHKIRELSLKAVI